MKSIAFIVIAVLYISGFVHAAEVANQDTTRTLIVARLLGQIDWLESNFAEKSTRSFKLCTFKSFAAYRNFNRNLNGVKINDVPVKIENIVDMDEIANCHAIFVNRNIPIDIDWLVDNNRLNKTLIIAEGSLDSQSYAKLGAHINLYLNKRGTFDFELNPDSFVESSHLPRRALLELGQVINNQALRKTNLLRSLINYTEWPQSDLALVGEDEFRLCSFDNNSFALFAEFYLKEKSLKGIKVIHRRVSGSAEISQCHALLIDDRDQHKLPGLALVRRQSNTLLIGNYESLGEKGVHFNLSPATSATAERFEINLHAFELSGHLPYHQLLNSSVVVNRDYPVLANKLVQIIQQTRFPAGAGVNNQKKGKLRLCTDLDDDRLATLRLFMSEMAKKNQQAQLELSQLTTNINKCNVIFLDNLVFENVKAFSEMVREQNILVIINEQIRSLQNASVVQGHFSLLIEPRTISLKIDLELLHQGGFEVSAELRRLANQSVGEAL